MRFGIPLALLCALCGVAVAQPAVDPAPLRLGGPPPVLYGVRLGLEIEREVPVQSKAGAVARLHIRLDAQGAIVASKVRADTPFAATALKALQRFGPKAKLRLPLPTDPILVDRLQTHGVDVTVRARTAPPSTSIKSKER